MSIKYWIVIICIFLFCFNFCIIEKLKFMCFKRWCRKVGPCTSLAEVMSHHSDDNMLIASTDSFWEPGNYKRTTKRIEDGYRLCSELMQLIQERADIEKNYSKSLKGWSKKWNDLIEKGINFFLIFFFRNDENFFYFFFVYLYKTVLNLSRKRGKNILQVD